MRGSVTTQTSPTSATVHVVNIAGASLMVRQKQIDTAFIAANFDDSTHHLCAELTALGIAQIFVPPQRDRAEPTSVTTVSLAGLRRKLRTAALA
jgi:hypothetical protein